MLEKTTVRIFLSSPSDVMVERLRADHVIAKVGAELAGQLFLETIRWEESFYTADKTFQDQILRPSETALVIVILWKRLGSNLPPAYNRPDRSPRTGTEYEFEEALAAAVEQQSPDILVYKKTAEIFFAAERVEEEQAQLRAVEQFWSKWFQSEEGHFTAAFHTFEHTDDFEVLFEKHVRSWLSQRNSAVVWPIELKGSPFRGLQPFEVEHAPIFFGRKRAVEKVRARFITAAVKGCAFMLLLGMSGVGKSSLIRAGVIPRLQQPGTVPGVDRWRYGIVRPGDGGLEGFIAMLYHTDVLPELAVGDYQTPTDLVTLTREAPNALVQPIRSALARWGEGLAAAESYGRPLATRLLVVIDQFEEIFVLPPAEQNVYVTALSVLARSEWTWVLAAMRSDFYPHLQAVPNLLRLKEDGAHLDVESPTPQELHEIITGPAQVAGLHFDYDKGTGESVEELLERAAQGPGSLPLLEFTLEALFQARDTTQNRLKLEVYQTLGGLEGALGRRAEEVFMALPKKVQGALPQVLRTLGTMHPESIQVTARTMPLDIFPLDSPQRALVDALSDSKARLLVAEGDAEEARLRVAHEALFSAWPRARAIIRENHEFFRIRHRIETYMAIWHQEQCHPDCLMSRGRLLSEAQRLLAHYRAELSPEIQEFITRSVAAPGERTWWWRMFPRRWQAERQQLEHEAERTEYLRIAGELRAAREVQMGLLPGPGDIAGLPSALEFHALLRQEAAVGGDFYDAFMMDEHDLFFLVGDVSGKGVPASLFMTMAKVLFKNVALREQRPLGVLVQVMNEEISRLNTAGLSVAVVVGIIDSRTGVMELCNAGHEAPILLRPGAVPCVLETVGGPPLCVSEDFPYTSKQMQLQAGDVLVMVTDGVTEARDDEQNVYGLARMLEYLTAMEHNSYKVTSVCEGLYGDVQRFTMGAAPSDDITIMAIRLAQVGFQGRGCEDGVN